MIDGNHEFYALQHRRLKESPEFYPDKRLKEAKNKQWVYSSWEYFGNCFKSDLVECRKVYETTGHQGWATLKNALRSLDQVRKAHDNGDFNPKNFRDVVMQIIVYEFRLVKISVQKRTEVVNTEAAKKIKVA